MASITTHRGEARAWRAAGQALWAALGAVATRINGSALPLHLDGADLAGLQRTLDG